MRKIVFIILLLITSDLFADDLTGTYNGYFEGNAPYTISSFSFIDNTYEAKIYFDENEIPAELNSNDIVYDNGGWCYTEKGIFEIISTDNIYYIEWNNSRIFSKYGIIYNEIEMYLFDGNNYIFTPGIGKMANAFPSIQEIKATSELLENTRKYYARNMIDAWSGLPWAEAVPGYGIGETVTFYVSVVSSSFPFKGFIISNGYVDFQHPDLYRKNARVKVIEVVAPNGLKKEYTIKDTSLFQTIELPENMWSVEYDYEPFEYRIIIKDVYKGDLWEDTCINLLEPIVPYLAER